MIVVFLTLRNCRFSICGVGTGGKGGGGGGGWEGLGLAPPPNPNPNKIVHKTHLSLVHNGTEPYPDPDFHSSGWITSVWRNAPFARYLLRNQMGVSASDVTIRGYTALCIHVFRFPRVLKIL